jgi:hypothetical protein
VQRRCEQLGVTLERQELDQVYRAVIAHADREKTVSDRDLSAIVARVRGDVKRPASASVGHDFSSTPAESGYGHGVKASRSHVLPGDGGIGPEVAQARRLPGAVATRFGTPSIARGEHGAGGTVAEILPPLPDARAGRGPEPPMPSSSAPSVIRPSIVVRRRAASAAARSKRLASTPAPAGYGRARRPVLSSLRSSGTTFVVRELTGGLHYGSRIEADGVQRTTPCATAARDRAHRQACVRRGQAPPASHRSTRPTSEPRGCGAPS